jgi:hypothetical protein
MQTRLPLGWLYFGSNVEWQILSELAFKDQLTGINHITGEDTVSLAANTICIVTVI